MRGTVTRLTRALECLNKLRRDPEDYGLTEFNISRCFADSAATTPMSLQQKFCLVHVGLDPLPMSGSFGGCIPDECTNVELSDIMNVVCALPSCNLLEPMEMIVGEMPLVEICGYMQRGLCGPDDRTMMQHDISFTCVAPPHSDKRRKLSEILSAGIDLIPPSLTDQPNSQPNSDDFAVWLEELDRQVVQMFEKLLQCLRLEELVDFASHLIDDLTHVVKDEFDNLWLGIKDDFEHDANDLRDIFRNNTMLRIEVLIQNVKRRLSVRVEALKNSVEMVEIRARGDDNVEKIKDLINTVQIDIKNIANNDIVKIEEHVSELSEKIHNWFNKIKTDHDKPIVSANKKENLRRISRILAQLDVELDFDSPIIEKIRDVLERIKILIQADAAVLEEDVQKFVKDVESFISKLYGTIFPESIPSSSTTEATELDSTTESTEVDWHAVTTQLIDNIKTLTITSTTAEVYASPTFDTRRLFEPESESTTEASQTAMESTQDSSTDLAEDLLKLKELLIDLVDEIRSNDLSAARKTFEDIEKFVTEMGRKFLAWSEVQIARAKMMLQKFRHKCLIDRATRLVKGRPSTFVPELQVMKLVQELLEINSKKPLMSISTLPAFPSSQTTDLKQEWPEAISKFFKELALFGEDVIEVSSRALAEAGTNETLRRDFEKLNKRFGQISYLFTKDVVEVWEHWKDLVEDDLTRIGRTIDDIRSEIKEDVENRLKESEELRQSIIANIEGVGYNWTMIWEGFWNRTISTSSMELIGITEQIRNLTKILEDQVSTRVQKVIDEFHNIESHLRSDLEKNINQLRADVQRMIEELKNKIDEMSSQTSTSTLTARSITTATLETSKSDIRSTRQTVVSQMTNQTLTKKDLTYARSTVGEQIVDPRILEESVNVPDLSAISEKVLNFLKTFSSETRGFEQVLNNITFVADIMKHFRPIEMFRDIEESKPLWTTQKQMESVFACGLESITEPTRLLNSGHMPQSLGDYEGCISPDETNSPNRYCFVKGSAVMGQGRCVSKTCDDDKMHEMTEFICSWTRHGRSCLELINIIPVDHCFFAALTECESSNQIPSTTDPTDLIQLPSWYNKNGTSRADQLSWWSAETMASLGLLSGDSYKLQSNMADARNGHTIDYNMTEIASDLGIPRYQVFCSRTDESYWNKRSIAGLCLIVTAFILLPLMAIFFPTIFSNRRITPIFREWLNRGLDSSGSLKQPPTSALDGMRVISVLWIIWGHTLATVVLANLLENYQQTIDLISSFAMQGVISSVFAVDTFFAISAFLLAFKSDKFFGNISTNIHQTDNDMILYTKTVAVAIYKRWGRLSPSYYLILGIFILSVPYLVSAPMYGAYSSTILYGFGDKQGCLNQWFWHLIYVDNLVPVNSIDSCMGWSWYLANEMQLSILGIALVVSRSRDGFRRLWWLAFIMATFWTVTKELQNHFTLGFLSLSTLQAKSEMSLDIQTAIERQKSYIRPWPRMLGYLIALSAGLHIADEQKHIESSRREANANEQPLMSPMSGAEATPMMLRSELMRESQNQKPYEPVIYHYIKNWIIPGHLGALLTMAVIMWTPWFKGKYFPESWPYSLTLLYNVFSRSIWTICVLWFVYTCFLAHHKIIKDPLTRSVNNLLSCRFFTLLAPLVFGVYLIHMMLQGMYYASLPITAAVSLYEGFHECLSWIPLSFAFALPLYLLWEVPAAKLV